MATSESACLTLLASGTGMLTFIKTPFQRVAPMRATAATILIAATACYDAPAVSVGPRARTEAAAVTALGRPAANLDDALRQIEDLLPGFGGLYVDDNDELVIRVRDPNRAGLAPSAVLQVLGRIPGRRGGPVRIHPADYTFAELQGWMRTILRSVSSVGIIEADINERANRLFLGVDNEGVASRIQVELTHLGSPLGAVDFQTIAASAKLSANDSLTSVSTPVVGGVMVQSRNGPQGGSKPHCTAGFNAWLLPDTVQLYLVINDHCTWPMGGVTGDTLWQSHYSAGAPRPIAIEVASAQYRALPDSLCWGGALCRYSDAALFRYFNSSDGRIGGIARPLWYSKADRPFTLLRDTAEFHINGDLPRNRLVVSGEWMSKVGVTTGWSAGKVSDTCILRVESTNRWLVCQFNVDDAMGVGSTFVLGGDSGSPAVRTVYSEDDPYGGSNWLAGILHAGGPGPGGVYQFTASDINLLYLDLGQMKTYPGPLCMPDPYYWSCQ